MTYDQLKKELIENFESDTDFSLLDIVSSINDEYTHYATLDKYCDKNIYIDEPDNAEVIGNSFALIDFQKNTTIPPMHSVVIKLAKKQTTEKINLRYRYRFEYASELVLSADVLLPKILKILRTIFWINKCRNEYAEIMKKRFAKLRFSNELQYWDNLFLISEGANEQYTKELEAWLDTQLSADQKLAKSNAYEQFWNGIPTERRHFTITSF